MDFTPARDISMTAGLDQPQGSEKIPVDLRRILRDYCRSSETSIK